MKKIIATLLTAATLSMPLTVQAKEVESVPIIHQYPELPTGCEATATTMLLQYMGVKVSKEDVANSLPRVTIPYSSNGVMYGGNPNDGFIGNPFSNAGFGVFHKPIADVVNKYLPHAAQDVTGITFEELLHIVDSDRPVVVWATIGMNTPKVSRTWTDSKGEQVIWKTPEHALLLIGYTDKQAILNDPYTGTKKYYDLKTFRDRWEAMGKQAVTVSFQSQTGFHDVSNQANPYWYSISYLHQMGVLSGYSNGNFEPNQSLTREEFSSIFAKTFGLKGTGSSSFNDVSSWAKESVNALYENGLIDGYNSSYFGAKDTISHQDATTIMWRYLKKRGVTTIANPPVGNGYEKPNTYALEGVQQALAHHLVGDVLSSQVYPSNAKMDRGEASALFFNSLKLTWNK